MTARIALTSGSPASLAPFVALVHDRIRSLPGVEHVRVQPEDGSLKVGVYLIPALPDSESARQRVAAELDSLATLAAAV